jgi:hypothetical protein
VAENTPLLPIPDYLDLKAANSASIADSERSEGKLDQSVSGRDQNCKTKPISEVSAP